MVIRASALDACARGAGRLCQGPGGFGLGGARPRLGQDPHSGHLFLFRGRRGDLVKVIWHDGQGSCLFVKRLERGRFVWPSTAPGDGADRTVTITPAQLGYLLEGIDWRMPQQTWRPQAAG